MAAPKTITKFRGITTTSVTLYTVPAGRTAKLVFRNGENSIEHYDPKYYLGYATTLYTNIDSAENACLAYFSADAVKFIAGDMAIMSANYTGKRYSFLVSGTSVSGGNDVVFMGSTKTEGLSEISHSTSDTGEASLDKSISQNSLILVPGETIKIYSSSAATCKYNFLVIEEDI